MVLGVALVLGGCSKAPVIAEAARDSQSLTSTTTQLSAAPTTVLATTTSAAPQVRRERTTTTTSQYLRVQTTTPADSYEYGEWAIPAYIVMCESKGNWMAHNKSSGASGPYQLMPLHFNGALAMHQSRAAQHAKAAQLWNGGKGKGHWSECL